MSLPRYPEYKDSGVEWLGEVPGHWKMRSLRYAATIQNGSDFKDCEVAEGGYPVLGSGGEFARISKFIYDQPSVLLGRKGTIDKPLYTEEPFWTVDTLFYTKIATDTHPKFFYWFCTSIPFDYFQFGSAVPSMTQNDLYGIKVPTPSIEEQQTIATFLDRETGKIDALIAEQRRLVELLAEKRQAVISHAVTKGLNPNTKMKDSGIEWLGEVPVHWEIKSIRYILDAIGDVDHFMPESVEKGVPYLMTGDLKEFVSDVSLDDCKQVSHNDYLELSKRIKSSKGDVIMARYATIGTSMYVDIDVDILVSYSCVTLKTNHSKVSGLYLFQYMKSDAFRQGVENQINTNTQGNVGIKDLQNVKIAVSPIDEQAAIAAFLDTETAKFDTLTAEANRAIALLQERRSSLISAAVTGKIDVRHVGMNPDLQTQEA